MAYAADGGPESLKEWEGVTESDFTQGRQTEALRKVDRIFEAATPVSTALADYGVTAERLAGLKTGRDAFADLASAPRQKASARSGTTRLISEQFAVIDGIIELRMDTLIEQFREGAVDFVEAYTVARRIVDLRGRRNRTDSNGDGSDGEDGTGTTGTPPASPTPSA